MSYLRKYIQFIIIASCLILLYFNLNGWRSSILGHLLLIIYILELAKFWREILSSVLGMKCKNWLTYFFGLFAAFSLTTLISSVLTVFYSLNNNLICGLLFFAALLTILIWYLVKRQKVSVNAVVEDNINYLFKKRLIYVLFYILFWLGAWYLLYYSKSAAILNSPWQSINQWFLMIFFILSILSGILVFSKFKTKFILHLLIFQTLILHLYLPLSHQNPWGGDVWRHVAVESKIQNGALVMPVLFGPEAKWREVVKIDVPEAFLIAQKYTYGHLWGTSVWLSNILQIDLITINKWLVPILWSVFFPLILYRLGFILFDSRRKGLILAWLSLLPFSLQAIGSLTLPVSFDLLLFIFVLMLWLQYLRDGFKIQRNLCLFLVFLMLFSYSLYFILILAVVMLSVICYRSSNRLQTANNKYQITNKILNSFLVIIPLLIIPATELIAKVSRLPTNLNLSFNFRQLLGQFSGWFYASQIRPHDIMSGNIIFNHTPDYAFVANVFNSWRWWLIPVMILIWLFAGIGWIKMLKTYDLRHKALALLSTTVFGGYIVGWFILDGDRLFTRRLDGVLAILSLILILNGISSIIYHLSNSRYQINNSNLKKILLIILILAFSWFTTFTYASGPDMRVVSTDEYHAAEYINNNLPIFQSSNQKSCVIADTWILLPLEALSKGKIVGGGFPIDYNFGQPKLMNINKEMVEKPSKELLNKAHELTLANECWFIGIKNLKSRIENSELFGEPVGFGDLLLWKEIASTDINLPLKNVVK